MESPSRDNAAEATGPVPGCTVWLTGLPSAGKSTVAEGVSDALRARNRAVQVLDGDQVRHQLGDLPFDRAGRDLNVRRIGWLAAMLARHGVTVLVAAIAPYRDTRDSVRALHQREALPFVEVHVAAPLKVCADRDVKGLYAKQRAGVISKLSGVDDPYEEPLTPDLILRTDLEDSTRSVNAVMASLAERGLI
ncbi:adenylyl-sulfate kinase [Kribbella sp. CA-293567]|uniref:adenylyl-sulfate kinase n=1 Tax=Kribbella sp. CA-293567 TaxID=3002436 RepID=UPI0022DE07AB|nr:adenylyl-sulfate kinase [Kribbella sp. CA-293567]WBQ07603.1 adenylyl-sulfate kinase [Kribbella sp. CA-293567]